MTVEIKGRLVNNTTIRLDKPLRNGEEEVIVRLEKGFPPITKLVAPEDFILQIAEKDLEELS